MNAECEMAHSTFVPSIPHSELRIPHSVRSAAVQIIDSHVHFWDPAELHYAWLEGVPSLRRAFLPRDYAAATGQIPIGRMVFVEANCRPEEARREVEFVERLAQREPRVAAIVAFVDLAQGLGTRGSGLAETLDAFSTLPRDNPPGSAASARSWMACAPWGDVDWCSICVRRMIS